MALDQLGEPVLLEGQRDELVERIAEDRDDRDHDRCDEEVGNRAARHRGRAERPSPRGGKGRRVDGHRATGGVRGGIRCHR